MNPPDDATATLEFAVRPPPLRTGPVLIAYDGTPASEYALWQAGMLLSGRRALVVTVWKRGLGFELVELPTATLGLPPAQVDIRTALEIDRQLYEAAQRVAERGAALAREAGFEAEGLAVAEDVEVTIAETILRVVLERESEMILVGIEGRGRLGEVILGSTSRDIIRHAPCPVVVARMPPEKQNKP
jgi:nucleotide-binding universal stress UspA family protein